MSALTETLPTPTLSAGFSLTRELVERAADDHLSGPEWLWLLRGPAGVVQFRAGRHRMELGACAICRQYRNICHFDRAGNCWNAWDLGYHSPRPTFEDQPVFSEDCYVLGGRCYYDGTSLGAGELLDEYLAADESVTLLADRMRSSYSRWLGEGGVGYASAITALTQAMGGAT